ncbi:hypothetical protein DHW03_15310 [Pedobacter yonginense]|uniref:Thioredoxin domain-containing protein n=1 Tax=Pedobacter yonginense TaxID=651869 RepID=A0A317EHN3_9SPHI|nr:TlpA disulfide reductase family protein [Pedobacter yonginense]PWS26162.1 hypothetical protein DHW03_15310 [Pedobacter yonginense]
MKKSTIFIVMALLCLKFNANSQNPVTEHAQTGKGTAEQFILGAKLPETFWEGQYSFYSKGQTVTQNLKAHQNKLVILDFWATWCTVCRKKLPMLDSMQRAYPDELAVIPINSVKSEDRLDQIANVLNGKFKPFIAYNLATIIKDESLTKMFPYAQLSHDIWIQDGRILAITGSDFLEAKAIEKIILENREYRQKLEKAKKQIK